MEKATFQGLVPILNRLNGWLQKHLGSPEIHGLLQEMAETGGKDRVFSIVVEVDVSEEGKEDALPLLNFGLSQKAGREPYSTSLEGATHQYVVDGCVYKVPEDRCPRCWDIWDFKQIYPSCNTCGLVMGKECKMLIDSDSCPWCEQGKVTLGHPRCTLCGFKVDGSMVIWG